MKRLYFRTIVAVLFVVSTAIVGSQVIVTPPAGSGGGGGGGGDALTTDPLSQFAATTSAQLAGVITDETGSGLLVFGTSPTLTTPALGTPSAVVLTNGTGLPIAGLTGLGTGVGTALGVNVGSAGAPVLFNGAGGTPSSLTLTNATGLPVGSITGLGSGVATWLATPSSANLATALTGETGSGAAVFGTAPAFTGPVTLAEAVGSSALVITGATQTASFPVISATQTWNGSGVTFTGIKLNVTNTLSAATSVFIDLQMGGVSKFSVANYTDNGGLRLSTSGGHPQFVVDSSTTGFGITRQDAIASPLDIFARSHHASSIGSLGFWSGTGFTSGALDLTLFRDAADVLAQRRTTNPQTFRIYNTYTDASNYERARLEWTGNILAIGTESAGTGTARGLSLRPGSGLLSYYGNASQLTYSATLATTTTSAVIVGQGGGFAAAALSGTQEFFKWSGTFSPGSGTPTDAFFSIAPTINWGGTPGAGSYEALKIAVIETALPTGTNYLIRATAGVAGTSSVFSVSNGGAVTTIGGFINTNAGLRAGTLTTSQLQFNSGSSIAWSSNAIGAGASDTSQDTFIRRAAAATVQLGTDVNGAAVAQTLKSHDGITGTDIAGANFTLAGGRGTGAGASGNLIFQTATILGSGTTAQTLSTRLTLSQLTLTFADTVNMAFDTTTGTKIGTATTQKIGFYNATPVVQGASVADATGGAVIDAEARTALNALISRIEASGLIATTP